MMKSLPSLFACTLVAGLSAGAQAVPVFDTFGSLPEATFNPTGIPSGIPNDAVAIADVDMGGGVTLTLGLTATERFSNPPVTNDGAGTFFATTGLNDGLAGGSTDGATWNFGFFAGLSSGTFSDYPELLVALVYDTDPSPSGPTSFMDLTFLLAALGDPSLASVIEGSQNLAFGFLNGVGGPFPGILFSGPVFDPFATGVYEFLLLADSGEETGSVAIDVIVEAVPGPGALLLIGSGLLMIGMRRQRIL